MKSIWYSFLFLLTAGHSFAQTPEPTVVARRDSTDSVDYYSDGIRIRFFCASQAPKQSCSRHDAQEIKVITGGTTGDWYDPNGGIIRDSAYYCIDRCKIRESGSLTGTILKDLPVDTGGTPANEGDNKRRVIISDTSKTLSIRGHAPYFYIDGIRVRGNRSDLPKSAVEEVSVITGGLPVNYGDINSSIIWINKNPAPAIPRKVIVSDKEQKMATE